MKKIIFCILFCFIFFNIFSKELIISYRAPQSSLDKRFNYAAELLKEAMEVTKTEYGEYKMIPAPPMNLKRSTSTEYIKLLDNYVFDTAATKKNDENLLPIKIPIYKGLLGYRIFLIDKNMQYKFDSIDNIEKLRNLRIGLGETWFDVSILRKNNFNVVTGIDYEGLFNMLLLERFDLFSRGINEIFNEYDERKDKFLNLGIEKKICLYYPFPRYFYTAKENTYFAERLKKGLEIIIENGTFDKIWKKYHLKILEKADLKHRKIFKIKNPFLPDDVPFDNPKYWYVPEN